ncbi:hypothetical protein FS749_006335 [Ceratobasidium sp. UAMH 11750]|nr:hypothetical protein FS749_006335 [Ceratobasidium sp. UAMH 11750]
MSDSMEAPASRKPLIATYFPELEDSSEYSSDMSLDSGEHTQKRSLDPTLLCLDIIHGFKKEDYSPINKPSFIYCKGWVAGLAPSSQERIEPSDSTSEVEVEDLLQAGEDTGCSELSEDDQLEEGEIPCSEPSDSELSSSGTKTPPQKASVSRSRTPATFPITRVRSSISKTTSPSIRYQPYA